MDIKLFPRYLPWLLLPEFWYMSKLDTPGWSKEDVREYIERHKKQFNPPQKPTHPQLQDAPSNLQDLFSEFDLSKLNMMWTFFWDAPKKMEQGWGFADMSEVNIVVAPSGRVEAYAAHPIRGMPGSTDRLGLLAQDLESYLEALFYAQFNKIHFISGFPDEDPILLKKTVLVAQFCALIAGGDEYYDFWAGLLGLPPSNTVQK
jgi:hypothetical protein